MKLIYLHNVYIVREEVYGLKNYNVNKLFSFTIC